MALQWLLWRWYNQDDDDDDDDDDAAAADDDDDWYGRWSVSCLFWHTNVLKVVSKVSVVENVVSWSRLLWVEQACPAST
jgi:hypothetical protein